MPDRDDRVRREYDDDPPRRRRRDPDDGDDRPPSRRDDRIRDDYDDRPARRRRDYDDEDDDYDDRPRRRRSVRAERMSPSDLRTVAISQKAVIFCILGNLATIPLRIALEQMPATTALPGFLILLAFYLAVGITATVFVFMMAVRVYGTGAGVALGILTLVPCVGLITLVIINQKATGVLQQHGIRVGFLGANMGDLPPSRRGDDDDD
jgi:hypothetical protein